MSIRTSLGFYVICLEVDAANILASYIAQIKKKITLIRKIKDTENPRDLCLRKLQLCTCIISLKNS